MFGGHPYPRSPWFDVAAVVFVLAVFLAPIGYLALEITENSGGFGGGGRAVASGGGGPRVAPAGPRSSFSAWKQRQSRNVGNPLVDAGPFGGSSLGTGRRGATAPFSSSWRAQAAPDLSGGGPSSYGTATGGSATSFGSGIRSPGPTASYGRGGRTPSGRGEPSWTAEAQRLAGRALALSNQLGQMDRDPVDRSLGEMAPSEGPSEGANRASGGASAAQTNANPGVPPTPTVPIDNHVHWLLAAGLLWGVWRLSRG